MKDQFGTSHPVNFALVRERTVLSVILLYAVAMFLDGFPNIHQFSVTHGHFLYWIEYFCTVFFIVEAVLKIRLYGWRGYWDNGWNRFDLFIVVMSLPSLLEPMDTISEFSAILVLRMARLVRLFKLLRFIPNGPHLWLGVKRALKASVGVFLALGLLNLLLAMGASIFFGKMAPEYFGDPLRSIYTLFKIFTLEGWYEIPEAVSLRTGSDLLAFCVKAYFVVCVLIGGILGLSLANAVFIDEMTSDNTWKVEQMVATLEEDVEALRTERRKGNEELLQNLQNEIRELRFAVENANKNSE